ncbi:MAG: hypothetical protein CVT63_07645 [Candidatus Anoxymicrobium japonicum]|uniref:Very short patch repair endonuclease n=1 Tax=Candidatus Anoxymicrobium japonicum TaxID=2013648 RepID=A0A2N3G4G7_9ACTN|nr:MAG: hypothetical protein CVT63_07645 [Candidatus Anoxymicrobium japonicum]
MADILSPAERSERMSRITGKNTAPELALRKGLHGLGLRYRLHGASLPGKPDLVFRRYKAVVFVHGCFWHRHSGCKVASTPKSNVSRKRRENGVRPLFSYMNEARRLPGKIRASEERYQDECANPADYIKKIRLRDKELA